MKLAPFFKYSMPVGIAGIALNFLLFVTNWYYELAVPVIEDTAIEGALFNFLDALIYYTPVIFMVLFAVYIIIGQIYMKRVHVANEVVETEKLMVKNAAVQSALNDKEEFLRHDYYTNCPKCGAVREENKNVCSFCGTSLIIEDKEKGDGQ